jgi:6-carboxyhexanoate--CoA ligase
VVNIFASFIQDEVSGDKMLSVRMRASRVTGRRRGSGRKETEEVHISGCEGLYEVRDITKVVSSYVMRALEHPRGKPDRIIITVEKTGRKPRPVRALPVSTISSGSPREAEKHIRRILEAASVSGPALNTAWGILNSGYVMRGASLVSAKAGRRLEYDELRGVRASRFGIDAVAEEKLAFELEKQGINTSTVKEALILASKVAYRKEVIAELCMSDDPGYTTGYVATKKYGYVRVPNIKKKGTGKGGRIFFLSENANIESFVKFLEKTPVLITRAGPVRSVYSVDEILDRRHL